jgi:hypothetical protein
MVGLPTRPNLSRARRAPAWPGMPPPPEPPGEFFYPVPNRTPRCPKATILIVSARDAPEAAADRTSAIARAAQCRITSPTHSPDPGGFRATIALLNGLGNGEARSLIALGHERRRRVAPDRRAHRY